MDPQSPQTAVGVSGGTPAGQASAASVASVASVAAETAADQPPPPPLANADSAANLAAAKANPKFQRIVQHIENLIERSQGARQEMEHMLKITGELKEQCAGHERECLALETDQSKVKEEVEGLTARMQTLVGEKTRIEQKLDELRLENSKLDAFLLQARENPVEEL